MDICFVFFKYDKEMKKIDMCFVLWHGNKYFDNQKAKKISYSFVLWHENKLLNVFFVLRKIDKTNDICFYNGQENIEQHLFMIWNKEIQLSTFVCIMAKK